MLWQHVHSGVFNLVSYFCAHSDFDTIESVMLFFSSKPVGSISFVGMLLR